MYRFFKVFTACFIIMLLLLTTTLGLAAVKQQQFSAVPATQGTYISIPFDISIVNPRDDTIEFVKSLLENATFFAVAMLTVVVFSYVLKYEKTMQGFGLTQKNTVVLLE